MIFKTLDQDFVNIPILRGFDIINKIKFIFKYNGFIAGGFARWCCSPNSNPSKYNDIDIFSLNTDNYYKIKSIFKKQYDIQENHDNKIEFTIDNNNIQLFKPTKDLICFNYNAQNAQEFIEYFDITISRIAITNTNNCISDKDFLYHEKNKIIFFKKYKGINESLYRIVKYMNKNYYVDTYVLSELLLKRKNFLINIKNIKSENNIEFLNL